MSDLSSHISAMQPLRRTGYYYIMLSLRDPQHIMTREKCHGRHSVALYAEQQQGAHEELHEGVAL